MPLNVHPRMELSLTMSEDFLVEDGRRWRIARCSDVSLRGLEIFCVCAFVCLSWYMFTSCFCSSHTLVRGKCQLWASRIVYLPLISFRASFHLLPLLTLCYFWQGWIQIQLSTDALLFFLSFCLLVSISWNIPHSHIFIFNVCFSIDIGSWFRRFGILWSS